MVVEDRSILRNCRRPLTAGDASTRAHVAQLAEHFLGKEEVSGSSPDVGSSIVEAPGRAVAVGGARAGGPERRPPLPELGAVVRVRRAGRRPMAATPAAVPARLDDRSAVVRDQRRHRVPRQRLRLERAALPRVVSVRRLRRGRLPRAGHGLPPQPDAVRLLRRRLVRAGRALQPPDVGEVRAGGDAGVRSGRAGSGRRVAGGRGRGRARHAPRAPLERSPDGGDPGGCVDRRRLGHPHRDRGCAGLRGRRDRHPGRGGDAGGRADHDPAVQHRRRVRARLRRGLLGVHLHAEDARACG